jgi:hypothetical protein
VASRRAIQAIAFAVVGAVLLVAGQALNQQSASSAQRANNNCSGDDTSTTVIASPVFWYVALVGIVLLVVAGLLGLPLVWTSRSRPQNPA